MKVNYMSDIHCEWHDRDMFPIIPTVGDVLVLAGDITCYYRKDGEIYHSAEWINEAAKNYEHVIYVSGNHEYYGRSISVHDDIIRRDIADNVHFLQNESVTIDGITFHGCTLWTEMGTPADHYFIKYGMNDFKKIRYGPMKNQKFTVNQAVYLHMRSMKFLKNNVKEGDVVITHHAPSFKSCLEKFIGQPTNPAYATDLSHFMLDYKPKFWIHGHVHNPNDYRIGGTNILSNPAGYPMKAFGGFDIDIGDTYTFENQDFDINKCFEV